MNWLLVISIYIYKVRGLNINLNLLMKYTKITDSTDKLLAD